MQTRRDCGFPHHILLPIPTLKTDDGEKSAKIGQTYKAKCWMSLFANCVPSEEVSTAFMHLGPDDEQLVSSEEA
ncbi:MAG: hypothetical protein GX575_11390 [Candidatus Anammoximicrobium sp.]|nr:hypothetical protein [Candidatus Anammoximicrobium sp.]